MRFTAVFHIVRASMAASRSYFEKQREVADNVKWLSSYKSDSAEPTFCLHDKDCTSSLLCLRDHLDFIQIRLSAQLKTPKLNCELENTASTLYLLSYGVEDTFNLLKLGLFDHERIGPRSPSAAEIRARLLVHCKAYQFISEILKRCSVACLAYPSGFNVVLDCKGSRIQMRFPNRMNARRTKSFTRQN